MPTAIISAILSIVIFCYLLFSFALWNLDPSVWSTGERFGFMLMVSVAVAFVFLLVITIATNDTRR